MDKTEARAIIKCMQKNDMTAALNCYRTRLIHQIQHRPPFICSLNSNHIFLVASLETIRVLEEYWGTRIQPSFVRGLQCSNISEPSVSMITGTMLQNSEKLSRLCHPLLKKLKLFNDPRIYLIFFFAIEVLIDQSSLVQPFPTQCCVSAILRKRTLQKKALVHFPPFFPHQSIHFH